MNSPTIDLTSATSSATIPPAELLFGDLAPELAATRRVLERVPDGHTEWQPHPKSAPLGRLATHVAELPRFTAMILATDELDWAKNPYRPVTLSTTAEIVALFDEQSAAMQAALAGTDWAALEKRWTMRAGDHVILEGPKGKLIRRIGINHLVHHRAQLGVYLRLLGVALPGIYGPTADEA